MKQSEALSYKQLFLGLEHLNPTAMLALRDHEGCGLSVVFNTILPNTFMLFFSTTDAQTLYEMMSLQNDIIADKE